MSRKQVRIDPIPHNVDNESSAWDDFSIESDDEQFPLQLGENLESNSNPNIGKNNIDTSNNNESVNENENENSSPLRSVLRSTNSTQPSASSIPGLRARRSQFSLSSAELIRNMANRFMYSKEYIIAYLILTILSLVTVVISLATPTGCPHFTFYILEPIVLLALLAEVGIRIIALKMHFFHSKWNILDAMLMILCALTFGFVFAGCSRSVRKERISSTSLLVLRNAVQLIRLSVLMIRYRYASNHKLDIDLNDVRDFNFDADAEDFPMNIDEHHTRLNNLSHNDVHHTSFTRNDINDH